MGLTPDDSFPSRSVYLKREMGKGTEHTLEVRESFFNDLAQRYIGRLILWEHEQSDAITARLYDLQPLE